MSSLARNIRLELRVVPRRLLVCADCEFILTAPSWPTEFEGSIFSTEVGDVDDAVATSVAESAIWPSLDLDGGTPASGTVSRAAFSS